MPSVPNVNGSRVPPRAAAAALAVVLAGGCAAPGRPPAAVDDASLPAAQRIERRAEAEAGRAVPRPAPVPPGVSPDALAARAPDDERARQSLAESLRALRTGPAELASGPPAAAPLDSEKADAALRHYARGRDAALRSRHFAAIIELEKAAELDPGSAAVLRQLARSYLVMDNELKAAERYEQLLQVEPDDSEALFTVGWLAADRRRFAQAAAALGRPHLTGRTFDHDPAAPYLADYRLGECLRQLGRDRACIEVWRPLLRRLPARLDEPSFHADALASAYRLRADLWRAVGDAHCRLGEYDRGLSAYRTAAAMPNPQALHARIIYAALRLGRIWSAQAALLAAVGGEAGIGEQEIALCGYLGEQLGAVDLLAEAVAERYRADPDDAGLARAAAVLLPRRDAMELLRGFIRRRPQDLDVVSQLLEWLVDRDGGSAAALAVALGRDRPRLAAEYGDRLAAAARSPQAVLEALEAQPPSPARAVVHVRVLASIGALGDAWWVCREARRRYPDHGALRLQQVELAARLADAQLLRATLEEPADDSRGAWLARARAWRALGDAGAAADAAGRAVELDGADAEALAELGSARLELAAAARGERRRRHAEEAAAAAGRAVELDPTREDAYAVLLAVYGAEGPLPDVMRLAQVRTRLAANVPHSGVAARQEASRDVAHGRYERALERLLLAFEHDPTDVESLELAVAVWARSGRGEAAVRWLEQRLRRRPARAAVLEQWARLQAGRGAAGEAVERLRGVVEAEPAHDTARALLEGLYRHLDEPARAVPPAEKRLLAQPETVRRELELASVYAAAAMDEAAAARLRGVRRSADEATFEQLVAAVGLAGRLDDGDTDRAELLLALALRAVDRFPDAPLAVYGAALEALARTAAPAARLDELAERAVRNARDATGDPRAVVEAWQRLAQRLVDAGQPEAAGRAVRARLLGDPPLEPAARSVLARVALAADAAAGDADASLALIERLALRDWLPSFPATEGRPTLPDVVYRTGSFYVLVGRAAAGERLMRETIRLEPDHASALNDLGYLRLEEGHRDAETVRWIERAYELAPDDGNVLDTIGWLRYKQGRFHGDGDGAGALELIRASVEGDRRPSAVVLDHLGDVLWRLDEAEGAADAWRRAQRALRTTESPENQGRLFLLLQTRVWMLLVIPPETVYDREYGGLAARLRAKLDAAASGAQPPVAATFADASTSGSSEETPDGGP